MAKNKGLCHAVIAHYHNGKNAPEISTTLTNRVHHVTVHQWIGRFNQSASVNGHKSSGRQHTERTKRLINLIKRSVRSQSTRKSSRIMNKEFRVSSFYFFGT